MDDNSRISLTKPGDNTQGWRDPATGEIYPNQPNQQASYIPQGSPVQQGVPQPANNGWQNGGFSQPQNVQQSYPQQNVPYQQPYQGVPQPYQQDASRYSSR